MKKPLIPFCFVLCFWACENSAPPTVKVDSKNQAHVFIQSDSVLMGEKIMPDGSIRKDNFHLDKDASPEDLEYLYRAYDVEDIHKDNIYLISTKQLYSKARCFFRLIRFDEGGTQVAARTFWDHQYKNIIKTNTGYRLEMKKPEGGRDWGAKGSAFQEVFLDKKFKTHPQVASQTFIQSDSVLMGEKMMPDGSVRKDNFYLDKNASPEDLPSLYRAYDVSLLSKSDNIYIVRTKQLYTKARTFFRIIRFDQNDNQVAARTFVDYILGGFIRLSERKYCIVPKLAGGGDFNGPDWGKKESSFTLLYVDKDFDTILQKKPCGSAHNEVERFYMETDTIRMKVRVQLGCTMCDHAMFTYMAKFGPEGELYDCNMLTRTRHPMADSMAFDVVRACLAE
jgi:hypothetical protein